MTMKSPVRCLLVCFGKFYGAPTQYRPYSAYDNFESVNKWLQLYKTHVVGCGQMFSFRRILQRENVTFAQAPSPPLTMETATALGDAVVLFQPQEPRKGAYVSKTRL